MLRQEDLFRPSLTIEDIAKPNIESHQVLVKIHACGVCHTDLHACHGDWPVKPNLPFVPGHEGVGEVIEVGSAVKHLKKRRSCWYSVALQRLWAL